MANYDGAAEAAAIIARAKTLAGGRVYDGIPDDAEIAANPDGSIKPFISVLTDDPVATARGRGLGKGKSQPYIMAISIVCVAANDTDARNLAAAVTDLFLEWNPTPSADEMIPAGGSSMPRLERGYVPTRVFRTRRFTVILNL